MGVVDPGDGVRFAYYGDRLVEDQRAFFLGVDADQFDLTGGEVAEDRAIGRQHNHVVVFLQRDDDLVLVVDGNKLGLRIFGRHIGQTGDVGGDHAVAIQTALGRGQDDNETGRHLAHAAIAQILIALILNGDGDEGAIGGDGDAVGLAAQIAGGQNRLAGDVHRVQHAGDVDVILGGVLAQIGGHALHGDAGRLARQFDGTGGNRVGGVGDVDEADNLCRAIGVDQRHAVLGDGDDLGRAFLRLGRVLRRHEGCDAVEVHVLREDGRGEQRQRRRHRQAANGHDPGIPVGSERHAARSHASGGKAHADDTGMTHGKTARGGGAVFALCTRRPAGLLQI